MDSDRCLTCLFGDKCSEQHPDCDFYFPIEELSEEKMLNEKMDADYLTFIEEWLEYTDEEKN